MVDFSEADGLFQTSEGVQGRILVALQTYFFDFKPTLKKKREIERNSFKT